MNELNAAYDALRAKGVAWRPPWRARESIVVVLIALALSALLSVVVSVFVKGDAFTTAVILVTEVALAISVLLWVRLAHGEGPRALGLLRPKRADVLAGVGTGLLGLVLAQFVVAPIVLAIAEHFEGRPVDFPKQIEFHAPGFGVLAVAGLSIVVVAPFAEELFFRGFLYRSLRRFGGAWPAALFSSAVWAGVHFEPLIIPGIFVLGLLLTRAFERHGGALITSIAGHAVFNLVGFTVIVISRQW